ncbi:hypothetical protein CesoFtcFv8_016929 [Champsocephalus esox]|uniref:Reverse transcriptase RNase H-like domain-containing protein n=1 Tax=Champsocephalus esox TaxID=159716 RepID=A0AAN8GQ77_9TELE|nr:hypothetical protein CesoFtcFv8_016929 [Champsocephalus esox]
MHPCAFFSRKLSPAERNYDIGNRELLAVKLALEEWRHWLEGAEQPFVVWTDHKNLEYIRSAKRLNSRQARWALFFTRFDFSLSYRPGSKNIKPYALSRQFQPESAPSHSENIIASTCVIGLVTWELPPVFFIPCLSLIVHGPTSPWILSPDYHPQTVTQSYSQS